jgi:hypothetical protein
LIFDSEFLFLDEFLTAELQKCAKNGMQDFPKWLLISQISAAWFIIFQASYPHGFQLF